MKFNSKDIIVFVLLAIVIYFITLLFVVKLGHGETSTDANKELVIYIIGVVSGYLGNKIEK